MTTQQKNIADSTDTARKRLFLAAEKLFAEKGFAATSIRDITTLADCNVAAVNYHFNGKDNLYRHIFRCQLDKMLDFRIKSIENAMNPALGQVSLQRLVRSFALSFVETLSNNPSGTHFIDLVVREMLDPQLPREMFMTEFIQPISKVFQQAFRHFCPEMDEIAAQRCMYSIVGQLYHAVRIMNLSKKLGQDDNPVFHMPDLINHIVQFSVAGINATIEEQSGEN